MNQKTKLTLAIGLNIALAITLGALLFAVYGTTAFDFVMLKKSLPSICQEVQQNGTKLQAVNADGSVINMCEF